MQERATDTDTAVHDSHWYEQRRRWDAWASLWDNRGSIGLACVDPMGMLIERNSRNFSMMDTRLIDMPRVKGGISRDIGGISVEHIHGSSVEGIVVGDIIFVERLSIFCQKHIAIVG